ncbi:MAG: ATP-binding protein [Pseudomonadota bacterium]|nr:ATP-binding protein [Pseudomonadota bacterium]
MTHTIASGAPSCAFVAFPRFGKTWAIAYSKERLKEIFPSLPIISFHAHHENRKNSARFFLDLLHQIGYGGVKFSKTADPREQLARACWVLAQSHDSKNLVIISDEMQSLNTEEYSWLIDLSNDLHKEGIRVTSILFGQPELTALRCVLRETHRGDIIGRFMSKVFAFEGISSATELHQVMACYDDRFQGEYPKDSGWCFTQFFLPHAYAHGWRLASCATQCWEEFKTFARARLTASPDSRISIGMEWVASALQYALTYYGDLDHPRFSISAEQWNVAIESTGFPDSLGLTYHPDWTAQL